MRSIRPMLSAISIAAIATIGLAGCSSDAPAEDPDTEIVEPGETEAPAEETPVGDGTTAAWAKPVVTNGEVIASGSGDGFSIEIYQVGTAEATKTGQFVDPDKNEPIIAVGDQIVFVNFVLTNTGSEAIPLSYSLVSVDGRYDDWPYMQGMDSVVDLDLFEEMSVNNGAIAPGSGDAPFMWEPGTSFAFGENFHHQANSPITFDVRLTPADAEGDLNHDLRQEFELTATIK